MAEPKPMETRVYALEEKDIRRDAHYKRLNTKIDDLTDSQKQIVMLLGGTPLNGNKGFISLLNEIEKRLDEVEKKGENNERDLGQVVWWGKLVCLPIIGLIIKALFDK